MAEARLDRVYASELKARMERQWVEGRCRAFHRPARWNDDKFLWRCHDGYLLTDTE